MDLEFAAATDVGRQRNHNEDNFLIDKKLQLFVVADGMGGHAAGEVASSITVHELRDAVHANRDLLERFASGDPEFQSVEILQMLEHAVQSACGAVYERAQAEKEKRGMGTTASVLLIVQGPTEARGFIAHVGDSRIYLTRQNQTHQLTEDHSLMNELVKRGKVKPGEIDDSPYKQFKNAVTRAVGVYASVEVDTFDFDILPGDQFLLCSDGMYVYFEEDELPKLLSDGKVDSIPGRLIDRANTGGGHDNITVVVIRAGDDAQVDQRAADLSLKLEVLKGMPLFRYLSYKELVRVMNVTETVEFGRGETLFREGEPGESMFVVLEGQLSLRKGDMDITTLGKGQHVGEMALVDRSPRSLSAVAATELRAVVMRRKDFYEIIKKEPGLSVKLLWSFVQVLAERLRKTTADLEGARTSAGAAQFDQFNKIAGMAAVAQGRAHAMPPGSSPLRQGPGTDDDDPDVPTERRARFARPSYDDGLAGKKTEADATARTSRPDSDDEELDIEVERAQSEGEPEIEIHRAQSDGEPEIEIFGDDDDDDDGDDDDDDDQKTQATAKTPDSDRGNAASSTVSGTIDPSRNREPRDTIRMQPGEVPREARKTRPPPMPRDAAERSSRTKATRPPPAPTRAQGSGSTSKGPGKTNAAARTAAVLNRRGAGPRPGPGNAPGSDEPKARTRAPKPTTRGSSDDS